LKLAILLIDSDNLNEKGFTGTFESSEQFYKFIKRFGEEQDLTIVFFDSDNWSKNKSYLTDILTNKTRTRKTRTYITRQKVYLSREFLEEQHITLGKNAREIAIEHNLGHTTLWKRLKEFGIYRNGVTGKVCES
jgi:hypothetical protein